VQRQERERPVVDLHVQLVQRLVAGDHSLDQVRIAVHQAGNRLAHALLRQAAHGEQPLLELPELRLEMRDDVLRRQKTSRSSFVDLVIW